MIPPTTVTAETPRNVVRFKKTCLPCIAGQPRCGGPRVHPALQRRDPRQRQRSRPCQAFKGLTATPWPPDAQHAHLDRHGTPALLLSSTVLTGASTMQAGNFLCRREEPHTGLVMPSQPRWCPSFHSPVANTQRSVTGPPAIGDRSARWGDLQKRPHGQRHEHARDETAHV